MVVYLLIKNECYKIAGLCMEVHATPGKGFKEIVYRDAIEVEFKKDATVPYEREKSFNIVYEEVVLRHTFNADFYTFNAIILAVKAVSQIPTDSFKQTINYLKASQIKLGILINFGADKLEFQRITCT